MSLLTPLYLLGALAIALPVVFHLIRRTTRQRMRFSSLMFLRAATVRLSERSRLEDRLLLVLRGLLLALLALGFSRPYWNADAAQAGPSSPPTRTVVVLDTSASMQRGGLWEEARRRAVAVAQAAGPADQIAVMTFDRRPRALLRFEESSALAPAERTATMRERLQAVEPGWGGTRLDQALIRATEWITGGSAAEQSGRREIVLLTDLQRGSELAALQAFTWPEGLVTRVELLEPRSAGNAGLQLVADRRELGGEREPGLRVRITNSPDAVRDHFALGWLLGDGAPPAGTEAAYVPGGQSRVISLPVLPEAAEATHIQLLEDTAAFDDALYVIPPRAVVLRVAYFGAEDDADPDLPLYFLRRAFPETPRLTVEVEVFPPDQPVTAEALGPYTMMVATDQLAEDVARSIHAAVQAGGVLLFAPRVPAALSALPVLTGSGPLTATEGTPRDFALLGQIDFQHPLLAPFATPAYSDFSGIHFWRYRRIPDEELPSARVLARFDSGDLALAEVPVGDGRVMVLASCWHPDDSQLALSSKFVPLLYAMLELAGGGPAVSGQYLVGDPLPLRAAVGEGAVMRCPDGSTRVIAAGAEAFTETDQPGVYRLADGGVETAFAVNIPPAETDTEPMSIDELAQLGIPFASPPTEPAADADRWAVLANLEVEARQRWWRWLVAGALMLAVAETGLAGWTARRSGGQQGAAT